MTDKQTEKEIPQSELNALERAMDETYDLKAVPQTTDFYSTEVVRTLFIVFGGGSAALATWFQNSLATDASLAQQAMLPFLLIALIATIVGLSLTARLAILRDRTNHIYRYYQQERIGFTKVLRFETAKNPTLIRTLFSNALGEPNEKGEHDEPMAENWDEMTDRFDPIIEKLANAGKDTLTSYTAERLYVIGKEWVKARRKWKFTTFGCQLVVLVAITSVAFGGYSALQLMEIGGDDVSQPASDNPPIDSEN